MRVVVDMNLSPAWIPALQAAGHDAVHWSSVGVPTAPDAEVLKWAGDHGCVVMTHDLDLGTLLALTRASGPSVIQVRTQAVLPVDAGTTLLGVLRDHEQALIAGALVTIDPSTARVRLLPLLS